MSRVSCGPRASENFLQIISRNRRFLPEHQVLGARIRGNSRILLENRKLLYGCLAASASPPTAKKIATSHKPMPSPDFRGSSIYWRALCGVLARPREPSRDTSTVRHHRHMTASPAASLRPRKTSETASEGSSSANKKASRFSPEAQKKHGGYRNESQGKLAALDGSKAAIKIGRAHV